MNKYKYVFLAGVFVPCFVSANVSFNAGNTEVSIYGFVRPTYSVASDSVSSFGYSSLSGTVLKWNRDNQVAATEASPIPGVSYPHSVRSHLTLGQSRIGSLIKTEKVKSQFEFDFIDFDRSESTTAIRPRLRIVGATFFFSKSVSLFAGQDWDIVSTPKPITYNFVSLYFRSGNVGFMRPQFRLTVNDNDEKEMVSIAIGAAGLNDSADSSEIERGVTPTLGFRYNALRTKSFLAGISALATARRFEPANTSGSAGDVNTKPAWLAKIFGELKPLENFNLRASIFGGSNAQSTSSVLSLATASYSGSQSEVGGFLNTDLSLAEHFTLVAGTGIDHILNGSEKRSGQLIQNWVSRLGADWEIFNQVHTVFETSYFHSHYLWSNLEDVYGRALQFEVGLVAHI